MTILRDHVHGLGQGTIARLLRTLTQREADAWAADWAEWAHGGQREPAGAWRTWVLMAGRGFGKTRAGAEWGARMAQRHPGARIALVAAPAREARQVMVEGPSGLLSLRLHRSERPLFEPSRGRVLFPNGSEAQLHSGANPEGLRGPQHDFAWCDELAKWRHPQMAWDMLQLGLRCGERPRAIVTTTPRAGCAALKGILASADTVLTGGASWQNGHLPDAYGATIDRRPCSATPCA